MGDLRDFLCWILKRVEHPLRKEERGPTVLPYVLLGRKVTLLKKGETEKDWGEKPYAGGKLKSRRRRFRMRNGASDSLSI